MNRKWGAVLAFAPAASLISVFLIIALGLMAAFLYGMAGGDEIDSAIVAVWFVLYFISIFVAVAINLIAIVIFCVFACKNKKLETGMRILWVVLIINFQFMSIPVYWWMYMRQK